MADIADHADDLAPGIFCAFANALAEGSSGIAPEFASHVLGDDRHVPALLEIGPGEIAAGDQRGAHGLKKARGHKLETAQGRHLALRVDVVLGVEDVGAVVAVGGDGVGKGSGGDAGKFGDFTADFLLHAEDALGLLHLAFGNVDAERLQLGGIRESRVDVPESLKGADHQAGADQQHHGQRGLEKPPACCARDGALCCG